MENEERAHLESHYQTELESVKNEVSRLTDLLEQLLRAKNGERTSAQQPEGAPAAHIPQASQNQGANSTNEQHFVPITPIQPTHAPITVDLTTEGVPDNRSPSLMDQDKLFALEERLRAVEGNDQDMYAKLLSIGHIALIPALPLQPPFPIWYKPELTC